MQHMLHPLLLIQKPLTNPCHKSSICFIFLYIKWLAYDSYYWMGINKKAVRRKYARVIGHVDGNNGPSCLSCNDSKALKKGTNFFKAATLRENKQMSVLSVNKSIHLNERTSRLCRV